MNTHISIYYLGYVRPCFASRCRCLKRETVTGLLEEIAVGLRPQHSEPPPRRERFVTGLPGGRRSEVFRFSSQSPRLRAADHRFFCFGHVGGRRHEGYKVSELGVARGGDAVWRVDGTLGPGRIDCPLTFPEVLCFPITSCYPPFTVRLLSYLFNSLVRLPPLSFCMILGARNYIRRP